MSGVKDNLANDAIFRWLLIFTLLVPTLIAGWMLMALPISVDVFNVANYTGFTKTFDLPIKVFTLSLTALGFRAVVFRSNQTAEQIRLTQQQIQQTDNNNTFSNYVAHRKLFEELLEGLEKQYDITFHNKFKTYHDLFPKNSVRTVELNSDSADEVFNGFLKKALRTFQMIKRKGDANQRQPEYYQFLQTLSWARLAPLRFSFNRTYTIKFGPDRLDGVPQNIHQATDAYLHILSDISTFAGVELTELDMAHFNMGTLSNLQAFIETYHQSYLDDPNGINYVAELEKE